MPPKSLYIERKYGELSWSSYANFCYVLFCLPFTLVLKALFSPFTRASLAGAYTDKPLKRRILDIIAGDIYKQLSVTEIQWMTGTGLDVYGEWTRKYGLSFTIEELESNRRKAHLFWVGPKRTDKVLLWLPGGGYFVHVQNILFKFARYAQIEWKKQGLDVGIAVLSYSVEPDAVFPTQLQQVVHAINHLLSSGCKPSDIQLVGDSAGGNLVSQLFSHMLHPLPSVPTLKLPPGMRFRGVYLMSPWVDLSNLEQWDSCHLKIHDNLDLRGLRTWGVRYLINVPESEIPYADPIRVPDDWYSGINNLVDRILVSTGGEECLLDQAVFFFERKIKPHHESGILHIQEGGLHDDPLLDFAVGDEPLENTLTPIVLDWLDKGFRL